MEDYVNRFQLKKHLDQPLWKLSGGTIQKLNLCLALMHSPDLLVLDEPFAAFDWESYLLFWEFVREYRSKGAGFLIVSHIIYDRTVMDQIYQLNEGRLLCD
jgi:ABC-type multidrug transport system ATPase subunit